ncbi:MAG: hypothetical protein IKD34_08540 [Oscillospiraceae bacterium]|nr:hypothetical protein [Oscillospiraceae bacterium]
MQLELTRGDFGLSGEIILPAWENWQTDEMAQQPVRIDFGGDRPDEGQELTDSYRTALSFLVTAQEPMKKVLLLAIARHLAQLEEDMLGGDLEDDFDLPGIPQVQELSDLMGEMQLEEVHILPVEKDGLCYMGYVFACSWDPDGIGIMTHGQRIVEVGSRDTALLCWICEDDIGHYS